MKHSWLCVYIDSLLSGLLWGHPPPPTHTEKNNRVTLKACCNRMIIIKYQYHNDFLIELVFKYSTFYPLTAKLFNLNLYLLEVVSRWRDPQLQVSENYSDLTKWRSTLFKYCWLMSHFIFNMCKRWYLLCWYKMKTWMYAAPAVKGLKQTKSVW